MKNSIAARLQLRLVLIATLPFLALFLFVLFDVDGVFDDRYHDLGMTGIAYEIGDHVVLPFLVLLPPMVLAIPWAVRHALAPLGMTARRLDAVSGRDRGFRVEVDGLPTETTPFATAVNDLLRRLDESAERHEAFAADIAHELKTPLAILQLELEAYGDPLAHKIKSDIRAMNRLIEQLLLIAQLDADVAARLAYDAVDLADVARDVVSRHAPLAIADGIGLELQVLGAPKVTGRREAIAAALRNLIENGLRVTPRDQQVTVIVGPGAELRVQDGGPGLTPARLDQVSQRLSRADNASFEGAGLGLAIVNKIMASHSGRLTTVPEARELKLVFVRAPEAAEA